jgi:hypothetical protein
MKTVEKSGKEVLLNRRHKDLWLHSGLTANTQFKVMDANFWETVDAKIYQHMLQDFLMRERITGTGHDLPKMKMP